MASRSSIRRSLAARVESVDITDHVQHTSDTWRHARLVDLLQPGAAWAHLSYAVACGVSRLDERQRRATEHTATEYTIVIWYAVREMTAAGGFDDLDLVHDLQEAVAAAVCADSANPEYVVRLDEVGQPMPVSTGPITTMMCQIDITVHHTLSME